jgi:hypothetical protein
MRKELEELLRFIQGKGRFAFFGKGITTYTGRGKEHEELHQACVGLEELSLIRRQCDGGEYVLWMPVED